MRRFNLSLLLGISITLLAAGCGEAMKQAQQAEQNAQTEQELRDFVLAYHNYCDLHDKLPPKDLAEFEAAAGQTGVSSETLQKIRDGKYIVVWGAPTHFYPDGQHHKMPLAYESKVPEEGGAVVSGGGTPSVMTAEEFAAAPKFADFPPQNMPPQNTADNSNSPAGSGQPVSLGAYDGPGSVASTDRPVTAVTDLYVGMVVQARDTGGWYAADVLDIQPDGQVKVHYRGWSSSNDSTLPLTDIQFAPDDVPQPPKP